jgi:hypothetical protein
VRLSAAHTRGEPSPALAHKTHEQDLIEVRIDRGTYRLEEFEGVPSNLDHSSYSVLPVVISTVIAHYAYLQ